MKDHLLGAELGGFKIAMNTLNGGRLGVAAQAIGIARASLQDALSYSSYRKTFGQPICQHQTIQNYLADMVVRIDAARYLTLAGARLKEQGKSYIRQAAMAKLFASETAVECALKCIQIHGGYGYVTDFPAERHLRDLKITEINEGTSEIQRLIIAGELLRERSSMSSEFDEWEKRYKSSQRERKSSFSSLSFEERRALYAAHDVNDQRGLASPRENFPTLGAFMQVCIGGGCGLCANLPDLDLHKTQTHVLNTCYPKGRQGYQPPSICRVLWDTMLTISDHGER